MMIRPFRDEDLEPIVALWNRCLPKDPISEDRFWTLFILDPNFEPAGAFVATIGDVPIGFLQAMVPAGDRRNAHLTVFFVDEAHRRQGVGGRLFAAALNYVQSRGCSQILCNGYSPYYVAPGVDVEYETATLFLQKFDFRTISEPVAMGMPLEGVSMPESVRARRTALLNEGFSVRMFERSDTLALLRHVERNFPDWKSCVLDGLRAGNREIVIACREGEVVGHTQWQNPQTDPPFGAPGRFGPFGVQADMRSNGIGAVIFYTMIERALQLGGRYLWFGWAGGRNLSFYERAGCRITRQFRMMKREL